jgi:lysozyme
MTKEGIELIKHFEGCRLEAYRCPAGVLTIGYGHTQGVTEGMTITQEEADELLKRDLLSFEVNVRGCVIPNLNDHQIDALTSFAYNVGIGNLRRSTLLRIINRGGATEEEIRRQFNRWIYAGKNVLPGLKRRRAAEADLYFTPSETNTNLKY